MQEVWYPQVAHTQNSGTFYESTGIKAKYIFLIPTEQKAPHSPQLSLALNCFKFKIFFDFLFIYFQKKIFVVVVFVFC